MSKALLRRAALALPLPCHGVRRGTSLDMPFIKGLYSSSIAPL